MKSKFHPKMLETQKQKLIPKRKRLRRQSHISVKILKCTRSVVRYIFSKIIFLLRLLHSVFTNTSKGRDRLLQIFQYTINLLLLLIPSCFSNKSNKCECFIQIARKSHEGAKRTRKALRFLRFIEEYGEIVKVVKSLSKITMEKVILILSFVSSMLFFLADNLLYLAMLGLLPIDLAIIGIPKDITSLFRNIFALLLAPIALAANTRLQANLETKIHNYKKKLKISDSDNHTQREKKLRKLENEKMNVERKRFVIVVDVYQAVMRGIMLYISLKIVGFQYIPPFVEVLCGFLAAVIDIYKTLHSYFERQRSLSS